tara:strand:+ start:713 stop:1447 length:735 start_codon:yes stop_codon:yes gene_type:complete
MLSKIGFYHKNQIYKEFLFRKPDYLDFLFGLVLSEISKKKKIKIIQVGAMDGVKRDPINEIITNEALREKILLLAIEPQEKEFVKLKKNYKNFNNVECSNCLIGNGDYMDFYLYKDNFRKGNKDDNNSGNSSVLKSHLEKYIKEQGFEDVDNYIRSVRLKSHKLEDVIKNHQNFDDADMLFIDAEGFDDQVIYNSSIDKFNFNIIGYEFKGLNESKLKDLHNYLAKRNYKIFRWKKSDELAIKI